MILLDTHIWLWWVHGTPGLSSSQTEAIRAHENDEIGVSVISCWEVAKLVQHGRLTLPRPLKPWFDQALGYPGVTLIGLTPEIITESVELPGGFHRDPADQLIVATARILRCPLAICDAKIQAYPGVQTIR
ncbi:MAG: type II toxin-antitoxin system VapC family toxin [Candidatus Sumerlaeota bacterium]|nr:type II toxin-antitoxin system VapC family toxin [Candidatus Sumerlaeota bacterium]